MARFITVGNLRALIKDMDDGALVLVPSNDHSLRSPGLCKTTAMVSPDQRDVTEDYGKRNPVELGEYTRHVALIIE